MDGDSVPSELMQSTIRVTTGGQFRHSLEGARPAIPLLLFLFLSTAWLWPSQASAQTPRPCQFILGFQTLHDLDPGDIGDCTDNQAFAFNGDAQ